MALFHEQDTRDELGLGPIRDSIADLLFPGTSTIQTRLRYMFFVPWIYQALDGQGAPPRRLRDEARGREIRLIDALRRGGETTGVIGHGVGAGLKRLPSDIYWSGLRIWGLRRFPGSREDYFASAPGFLRDSVKEEGEAVGRTPWSPMLPAAPDGFLEEATFQLRTEEAAFLLDQIVQSCGESLLAVLARDGDVTQCDQIWEHPGRASFPERLRELVNHAEVFSAAMHGAALLYNLMLSEDRQREDWVEHYRAALADWHASLDHTAIVHWSLGDFWRAAHSDLHVIRPPAERFVTEWQSLLADMGDDVAQMEPARRMVRERETRLKGAQSRFRNRAALARWGGKSGTQRFNFRWAETSSHLRDLAHAA